MLQTIKRLTKHSIVYGIGHIISRSLGFLLLPIHTNILPTVEYRIAALLFSSLAIMNVFFSYGMDVAFLRFFILEEDKKHRQLTFSTAFWMIFSTGILFAIVMSIFPSYVSQVIFQSSQFKVLIRIASGILFFDAISLIPFLMLRGEERSTQFVLLKSLNIIFNLIFNIVFVVILKQGVTGIFVSNLLASFLTLISLIPIFFRWLRFRFHFRLLYELLQFGLPYVPSGLAIIVMDQIGRFFLDRMVGEEATAIFSAAYKLGMIMALVVAAFRFAWHPFFLSTSKQPDAQKVFARVLTYFVAVTGLIFLIFSFFLQDILSVRIRGIGIMGEAYEKGILIVPIVMLAYIFYGIYTHFVIGIYLKKKTYYLPFITGLGAIVNVAANLLLIPLFTISGAAWATFLAYFVMAFSLFWVNRRLYFIPYEYIRLLKLVVIFILLFWAGYIWGRDFTFLIRSIILLSFFPLLYVFRFFYSDERRFLRKLIPEL